MLFFEELVRCQECDPILELDFFWYTDVVRDKIVECVAYKVHYN